ncbi:MAG: hypothetical protein RR137_08965 [Odoribacter sp.]
MILRRLMLNAPNVYVRWNLYTQCSELPLDRFIRCLDGDLSALKKHLYVPKYLQMKVLSIIIEEYAKLSGDSGYEKSFLLSKEMARDACRLSLIRMCIKVLLVEYNKRCVDVLISLGYNYRFDNSNPIGFKKDIDRIEKNARMLEIEISTKRAQYDKIFKKKCASKSSGDFVKALTVLSKYMGYRIDPKLITVNEYVSIRRQYDKETTILQKQKGYNGLKDKSQ